MIAWLSPEEIEAERVRIDADHFKAWESAWRLYEVTKALLLNHADVLAKASGDDLTIAKRDADRLRRDHDRAAAAVLSTETAKKIAALLHEHNERIARHNKIASKAMHFDGGYSSMPARSVSFKIAEKVDDAHGRDLHPALRRMH